MTILEQIKEFIAVIGLLPLVKKYFSKPIYYFVNLRFKMSSTSAINLLHEAIQESRSEVWLEFGSFLGAFRNNSIISHDFDIDFAVKSINDLVRLEKELLKRGFKLIRTIVLKSDNSLVEKTYSYKGAHVDFFVVKEDGRFFTTYDFSSIPGKTWGETINFIGGLRAHKNTFSKFDLEPIEFMGLNFMAPSKTDADKHLKELYGDDYKVPNSKWSLDQRSIRILTKDVGLIK
ncbi:MAG: hypothetical protein BM556_08845 [Bacteriovorax sp. MedPE-SWde]|nr:MAG: hypothetical protein BM556_08845 [Bacteriovorax sp. MedPE-SWde]